MDLLKPCLLPEPGESLISWLNRFGHFHSGLSLDNFLRFIGVRQQDLNLGRREICDRLSTNWYLKVSSMFRIASIDIMVRSFSRNFCCEAKLLSAQRVYCLIFQDAREVCPLVLGVATGPLARSERVNTTVWDYIGSLAKVGAALS